MKPLSIATDLAIRLIMSGVDVIEGSAPVWVLHTREQETRK